MLEIVKLIVIKSISPVSLAEHMTTERFTRAISRRSKFGDNLLAVGSEIDGASPRQLRNLWPISAWCLI